MWEVLLVGLHVLGQLLDALGQDGDLNLGVAGVDRGVTELGSQLSLALFGNSHCFTFRFLVARGRHYSPRTGKPSVERASKVEVPTGRYVTTSRPPMRIITDPT